MPWTRSARWGAIFQRVVKGADDERRALSFFERLWEYDQIVFDASCESLRVTRAIKILFRCRKRIVAPAEVLAK
jgi:hypothetical protein